MQKPLLTKIGVIFLLCILLLIPIAMIDDKISERNRFFHQAKQTIADSWVGAQQITGPALVVPYTTKFTVKEWDDKKKAYEIHTKHKKHQLILLAEQLSIKSQIKTELRYKGIYQVPVYLNKLNLSGYFDNTAAVKLAANSHIVKFHKPYIGLAIEDVRGITEQPKLLWKKIPLSFSAGSKLFSNSTGLHALIPKLSTTERQHYPFQFDLNLRGMEAFRVVPAAKEFKYTMSSNWPHPNFGGKYLPIGHNIHEKGFSANWSLTSFASSIEKQVADCQSGHCQQLLSNTLNVDFIEPVNVYLQSERSIKYAMLFIGLLFISFFIFEIIKKLSIHPIQYGLVGMALAIFYLLLVSLSEHINFDIAYACSTAASAMLLFYYIRHVLKSFIWSAAYTAMVLTLYGILFVIISSEDFALLMGSILLFMVLGITMIATRKIDWYGVEGYFVKNT